MELVNWELLTSAIKYLNLIFDGSNILISIMNLLMHKATTTDLILGGMYGLVTQNHNGFSIVFTI
jgi:hypothetical protein